MSGTATKAEEPPGGGSGASELLKVLVVGDVMLGRLVDQIFPTHNEEPENRLHAQTLLTRDPQSLNQYHSLGPYRYVWGDTLPLFHDADLRLANLETSLTDHPEKWPRQAFNFRAHPDNVRALQEARIDFLSLANNHILDFKEAGMHETQRTLDAAGIRWAGAGDNLEDAARPAMLQAHSQVSEAPSMFRPFLLKFSPRFLPALRPAQLSDKRVACFSLSDHFDYWAAGPDRPGIWLVDPGRHRGAPLDFICRQTVRAREEGGADMVFVSIHWGPNWGWKPSPGIRQLAHDLVDTCGVNLVHGTSAHHIQGIEHYGGAVVLYGCGDFVDDYAVDESFRSNLSFAYVLHWDPDAATWHHVELVPTKIRNLGVTRAVDEDDREWLARALAKLSEEYGTRVEKHPEGEGRLLINLTDKARARAAGS